MRKQDHSSQTTLENKSPFDLKVFSVSNSKAENINFGCLTVMTTANINQTYRILSLLWVLKGPDDHVRSATQSLYWEGQSRHQPSGDAQSSCWCRCNSCDCKRSRFYDFSWRLEAGSIRDFWRGAGKRDWRTRRVLRSTPTLLSTGNRKLLLSALVAVSQRAWPIGSANWVPQGPEC